MANTDSLIDYAPLNTKQTNYIKQAQSSWFNVLEGGKRSSKNVVNLLAWAVSLETHPDSLHLAGGVTQATAKMNIIDSNGFGLKHIFEGRCREGEYQNIAALFIRTNTGEKIILQAGGGKANDAARIKGFSLGSAYLTEVNEMSQTFVQECFDRTLASSRRQVFHDLNPKPPRHWYYTDVLDFHSLQQEKIPTYGLNKAHMTVADNHSFTDEQLRQLLATYDPDSQWFKRDILGQRTSASGRIYTSYSHRSVAVSREWIREQKFIEFSIGVDVGGTDATVATLKGFTPRYEYDVVIDGYYDKQGIESGKDQAQYAEEVVNFLLPWVKIYPQIATSTVFADSADKLFRQALRNALDKNGLGGMSVIPSYKADGILDRINVNRILLNQGRKKIADHLRHWHEAYQNAVWDSEKYAEKDWVRVDDGSYPVDCLDSDEYSNQPYKRELIEGYF